MFSFYEITLSISKSSSTETEILYLLRQLTTLTAEDFKHMVHLLSTHPCFLSTLLELLLNLYHKFVELSLNSVGSYSPIFMLDPGNAVIRISCSVHSLG